MIDVGKYLGREFHWKNYNCWDFIREVWIEHAGVDLGKRTPESVTVQAFRKAFEAQEFDVDGAVVRRLEHPIDPCLVLMIRPNVLNHVGVFVQGRVLHLLPKQRVQLQDFNIATMGFSEVRFYT